MKVTELEKIKLNAKILQKDSQRDKCAFLPFIFQLELTEEALQLTQTYSCWKCFTPKWIQREFGMHIERKGIIDHKSAWLEAEFSTKHC